MAKKQTFGQKVKKGHVAESQLKVIYSHKKEDKGTYAFQEKIISIDEGSDPVKAATEAFK